MTELQDLLQERDKYWAAQSPSPPLHTHSRQRGFSLRQAHLTARAFEYAAGSDPDEITDIAEDLDRALSATLAVVDDRINKAVPSWRRHSPPARNNPPQAINNYPASAVA